VTRAPWSALGSDESPRQVQPRLGGPQDGTVLTWTVQHVTPEGVAGPRTVALVELSLGSRVLVLIPPSVAPLDVAGGAVGLRVGGRLRLSPQQDGPWLATEVLGG